MWRPTVLTTAVIVADLLSDDEEVNSKRVAQHLCDYCRKDISLQIRIKCCQCADFVLCVGCFADGIELNIDDQNSHLRTHPYRVIDRINASIFDEEWTADDELMLLEGLERYGMGNWQEIANHIGSKSKNKSKIEQHYCGVYLNSKTKPLPDPSTILNPSLYGKDPTNYGLVTGDGNSGTPDHTIQSNPTSKKKLTADAQAAGYRAKRRDFDTEFDNGVEELLNDCSLYDYKDDAVKLRLTYKMLDVFNRKLDERVERKKFLIDRGLLWVRSHPKQKHNKEFKALYQQAKVFNRFFSSEDEFNEFVEDLHVQRVLVRDVSVLREHRRNGIRSFQEEFVFEEQSVLREAMGSTAESQDTDCSPTRIAGGNRVELAASAANDLLRRRPYIPEHCIANADGFDISNMECVELLDMEERAICTKFRLLPRHFNMLKQKICLQSYAQGYITLKGAIHSCEPLDSTVTTSLFNLFLLRGLINSVPARLPSTTMSGYELSNQKASQRFSRPPLPKKPKIKKEPSEPHTPLSSGL